MSGLLAQCTCGCHDRRVATYRLDEETGCWNWTGYTDRAGYGRYRDGDKIVAAHRWAYEQFRGPIPEGLVLDHLCRNTSCVNPEHLEPVTTAQNTQRGATAVLTWTVVREIRASGLTCTAAAKRFGISEMQAWRVLTHKTWKEAA